MNALKNRVQLIGFAGKDPEVKRLSGGKVVASFSLATSENYKDQNGEKVSETHWHTIIAWGKTAEIVEQFINKGKEVAIEGKLTYRSYEDKQGNKKSVTEIIANEILLLGTGAKARAK